MPVAIAPTGLNGLIRPSGDQLIAQAAAAQGIPFILSTAANCSLEQICDVTGIPPWFQLYVMNREDAFQLIDRARALACKVLVVTVDVPVSGNRIRDLRNGFTLPFKPTWPVLCDCINRPAWSMKQFKTINKLSFPMLNSGPLHRKRVKQLFSRSFDTSFSWKDIAIIRDRWKGVLVLKGILNPDDAVQACKLGVDGIIVSNHGGRQLECAPASLTMLPAVVAAVKNKITVFLDGGIRSGEDVLKALALGADGVLAGRLPLYGLAAAGGNGVSAIMAQLQKEILTAMSLTGCTTLNDVRNMWVTGNMPTQVQHINKF